MPTHLGMIQVGPKTMRLLSTQYSVNKRLAVFLEMEGGEPFVVISENHFEAQLDKDEFVVQSRNWTEGLLEVLLASGHFIDTGRRHCFGPFKTEEPIWKLANLGEVVW